MMGKQTIRAVYRHLRSVSALTTPMAITDQFLRPQGFLRDSGWLQSYRQRVPTSQSGPLPWFTYSAIAFLQPRLNGTMKVFEYGAGYSTLWWAERVQQVVSCESDQAWVERLSSMLPRNARVFHEPAVRGGRYCRAAAGEMSDVIVIDGRDRVNCARECLPGLTREGVIVWDNSDRPRYRVGYDWLAGQGFRRVEFYGPGPVNFTPWGTSVFYRDGNCLGL